MSHRGVEFFDRNLAHALKCQTAAEILRSFGALRLRVTGHSMLPSIWPGDTLVIERRSLADISPGDIVLYSRHDKLFAHRVLRAIAVENPQLITQGDALPNQDAPVSSVELLGRVSEILHEGHCIQPPAKPAFAARCAARILRRSALLSRLFVHLRARIRNSQNREGSWQT